MINLLDPLYAAFARLIVARGILFPEFVERMKLHYVNAARQMAKGKITDSRLSVLTGLQRRDIARLRDFRPKPSKPTHLSRLVALWQTEATYAPDGKPQVLPKNGPAPSFEALARNVRRDVHARTMLDTLVETGTVEVNDTDQTVRLRQPSYQPLAGSEDQLTYLANNIGDHLNAATDNVLGYQPPHFERAVHYTHLTPAQVAELKAEFDTGQMALLERLGQKAAAMKKLSSGDAQDRFRAGGYFYRTTEGDS
ncbi:DUF6502 family protein [Profundibacter sp.]